MSFWCLQLSQKKNEDNSTWGTIEVKSNFFACFLEELKIPKRHFEINWPLRPYDSLLEYFCKILEVYLEIWKDSSHCDLKTTLGNANCCFHPKKTTRICKKLPNFGPEFSLVFRLRKKERSFPTIFFLLVNMKTLLLLFLLSPHTKWFYSSSSIRVSNTIQQLLYFL